MRDTLGFPAYFDGNSLSSGVRFNWKGVPHDSSSYVELPTINGWTLNSAGGASSATGIMSSETEEAFRARRYSAFAYAGLLYDVFTTPPGMLSLGVVGSNDFTADPLDLDQYAARVEPSVKYSASIAASLGKLDYSQRGEITAFIVWRDVNGDFISQSDGPGSFFIWGGGDPLGSYQLFRTYKVTATSPAGAYYASVGVRYEDEEPVVPPSTTLMADTAILVIGDTVPEYFDGATPDDANFSYSWDGAADGSESTRVGEAPNEAPGEIVDPNCPPPPPAPLPPQPMLGCSEPTAEWRRAWYVIPEEEVYEWGAMIPSFVINSGADPIDVVRITVWANPNGDAPANFDDSVPFDARWNISYLPANSEMRIDGTTQRITATQPGGVSQDAGHLVTGPSGGPVLWTDLTCGDGYLVAVDIPLGDDPNNVSLSFGLTREFG